MRILLVVGSKRKENHALVQADNFVQRVQFYLADAAVSSQVQDETICLKLRCAFGKLILIG